MGFRMVISGTETISLTEKEITQAEYKILTPQDSNARSTDLGVEVKVWGKIIPSIASAEGEPSIGLERWANVSADRADCYRGAELEVINAGVVVRKFKLPNAFVVSYEEDFSDQAGNGSFYLHIRQKKDKVSTVSVEGGFSGE